MESKIKIGCLILLVFFILFTFQICKDSSNISESKKNLEYSKAIEFKEINQSIYIKTKMWGLLGGHSCIFFTKKNSSVPDEKNDIVFHESEGVYYRQQGSDSLFIFLSSGSFSDEDIIDKKIGRINIRINKFKASMNSKYENDYKNMGLSRIDCYNGIE